MHRVFLRRILRLSPLSFHKTFHKMQKHLWTVLVFIHFAQVQAKVQELGHPWARHHRTYCQDSTEQLSWTCRSQIRAIKIDLLWECSPALTTLVLITTNESLGVNRKSDHGLICFTTVLQDSMYSLIILGTLNHSCKLTVNSCYCNQKKKKPKHPSHSKVIKTVFWLSFQNSCTWLETDPAGKRWEAALTSTRVIATSPRGRNVRHMSSGAAGGPENLDTSFSVAATGPVE